jgi:hypothetical protein
MGSVEGRASTAPAMGRLLPLLSVAVVGCVDVDCPVQAFGPLPEGLWGGEEMALVVAEDRVVFHERYPCYGVHACGYPLVVDNELLLDFEFVSWGFEGPKEATWYQGRCEEPGAVEREPFARLHLIFDCDQAWGRFTFLGDGSFWDVELRHGVRPTMIGCVP